MPRPKGAIGRNREVSAAKLRKFLKPIYEKLARAGVPEVRMPSNDAMVSHLIDWVDETKVDDWVTRLALAQGTPGAIRRLQILQRKKAAKKH